METVWSRHISHATESATVLTDLVDTKYEAEMKSGRVLQINDMSNPAVRFKTEDTSATWSNRTETNQSLTINRQAYCAMLFEDIAEIQANVSLRGTYTSKMGYSLMATVEGDATSGMASLPSSFSQVVGTLTNDPTEDDLLRAVQYLNDGDVPRTGRFFYVSPATHIALLKMDLFRRSDYVGDKSAQRAVKEAMVGQVYGAGVYESVLANNNPAAANSSYSWFCHKEGVALIRQKRPSTKTDWIILEDGMGVYTTMLYQFVERLIPPSTLGGGTSDDRLNVAVAGA